MCEITSKLLELAIIPTAIGVATGVISSYIVSRRFLKKALLDECVRLVNRLCPYRKENIRDGDGLDETSWALQIQSEILKKNKFIAEAQKIEAIGKEIGASIALPDSPESSIRKDRDDVKKEWQRKLSAI